MTRVTELPPHELTKLLSPPDETCAKSRQNLPKHAGLVALGALIWSWVLQAEASQGLQAAVAFNKPFFIVCFNHTAPVVLLPLLVGYFWIRGGEHDRLAPLDFVGVLERHSVIPLTRLWRLAAFLSAFYCVTDYFWYAALANVSVAAGTAIFNCSPLFVYCFSICFLHERLSLGKMCGVFTSFVGVTMIVMFQNGSDLGEMASTGVVAGLLVVLSAALYGGYEVAIKLTVGDGITDTATLLTMTGLCGLFTIPLWLTGSFLLAYSPIEAVYEPLGLPDSTHGLLLMLELWTL
ncbi:putative vacuolar membrane protein [Phytophthora cinnamomi]|uniref:putative vacuolar membrane protein n=1 Tax=Phytophthora cinnamomi TaxID=4785 RepID=UPI00355A9E97|nr:putative vacuolar membrane protein [Phytophthora cinnamomi]